MFVVALSALQLSYSQELATKPTQKTGPISFSDSARVDSLPRVVTRRLLPPNMSFAERGLWGEDGLTRRWGLVAALTPEERQNELKIRRTMLSAHQIGGFVTLGFMAAACYFGQRSIDDRSNRNLLGSHQTFETATIISYSATGLLSVLSPPPMIRRDEISTTTIHKTLAWIHFTGMVVTPILGSMIGRNSDSERAHIHQISGYITTAVFAASMIVITL